ncbi:hypothetical protein [Oceanobacillus piezotolerans]|uniref:hypothetical protein n=1 Tax=Oceanobacillus piezotolerans TaxID=2448030 RepID=UPI001313DDD5|nr:hypothetical protein [Oceanobacillus piezotolerans]
MTKEYNFIIEKKIVTVHDTDVVSARKQAEQVIQEMTTREKKNYSNPKEIQ